MVQTRNIKSNMQPMFKMDDLFQLQNVSTLYMFGGTILGKALKHILKSK